MPYGYKILDKPKPKKEFGHRFRERQRINTNQKMKEVRMNGLYTYLVEWDGNKVEIKSIPKIADYLNGSISGIAHSINHKNLYLGKYKITKVNKNNHS